MSREHNIIIKPVITEKTTIDREMNNRYTFEVAIDATKNEIKKAIEKLFEVKVIDVTLLNKKGKMKRVRYKAGKTATVKRAMVKLEKDNIIKFFEGK